MATAEIAIRNTTEHSSELRLVIQELTGGVGPTDAEWNDIADKLCASSYVANYATNHEWTAAEVGNIWVIEERRTITVT